MTTLRAAILPGFVLAVSVLSYAQVSYDSALLHGSILDPHGAAVPGAAVTVTNTSTGLRKSALSGEAGYYQVPALAPGDYRVTVEAAGFSKAVKDIVLTVGEPVSYNVHLVIGTLEQEIEVTDQPPVVDVEQTQQANTVNQVLIGNLPNIGRRVMDLGYILPGVANSNAPSIQDPSVGTGYLASGFSIGGSNGRNNLITIDGGENDYGSGAPRVRNVPLDSVQEFQVNRSSFAAEFGNTVGTAISVVTRSGSNKLHGTVSSYFRNRNTDSGNYFNRLINPGSSPFEQSVISGFTLGGPVRADKMFFFTAYENQKLDSATSQNYSGTAEFQSVNAQTNGYSGGKCPGQPAQVTQLCYLTQLGNSGTPAAPLGAALLASPVSGAPLADPILSALVLPNQGTFDGIISTLAAVRGTPGFNTPRGRYNNWVSRVDYHPSPRDSIMARFSLMHETDSVAPQPPTSTFDLRTDYTVTSAWTHSFSPQFVNVFRMQGVPQDLATAGTPYPDRAEIDLLTANSIVLGNPFSLPYGANMKRFQFDDNIVLFHKGHSFKFGESYQPDHYNLSEKVWFGGQWSFADGAIPLIALAPQSMQADVAAFNMSQGYPAAGPLSTNLTAVQSFLAGTPISLIQANPSSNTQWKSWDHHLGVYAQDTWKISPKVTLNYGVRLDYDAAPAPVPRSIYVSPRTALAWDPEGTGKTAVRVGGGLFVAPVLFMVPFYVNTLGSSGKYINQGALSASLPSQFPSIFAAWAVARSKATAVDPNPPLSPADLASIGWAINPPGPKAFGSVFSTLDPNFKPQYTIQASTSIARQIAPNLSIETGYSYYRSVHIEQVAAGNYQEAPCNVVNAALTAAVDPFVGPCYVPQPGTTAGVPNSLVFVNDVWSPIGSSVYHGLTASLNRRFSRGLQLSANYTLSRAQDNTSDFSNLSVPFRPDQLRKDWSVSDFNVTHNFVANAVYMTPFQSRVLADVSVSTIVALRSGIPFTLLAPGLGGLSGNGTIGHTSEARPWNEPRNEGRGDSFRTVDLRIAKSLYFDREKGQKLELIAQFQNLFNRTNFAAVNNIVPADPNFALPNGGNLLNGPYTATGFAPTSISQLSQPLAFASAYPARYISFAVRLGF